MKGTQDGDSEEGFQQDRRVSGGKALGTDGSGLSPGEVRNCIYKFLRKKKRFDEDLRVRLVLSTLKNPTNKKNLRKLSPRQTKSDARKKKEIIPAPVCT